MGGFAVNVDLPDAFVTAWNFLSAKFEPVPDGKSGSFSSNTSAMSFFGEVDDAAEPGREDVTELRGEDAAEPGREVAALASPCAAVLNAKTEVSALTFGFTAQNEHILT